MTKITPDVQDLLLVIDVQNDFCPGGSLAVPGGDEIVGPLNGLMQKFKTVVLTQDWHPAGHSSFASSHDKLEPYSVVSMPYGAQTLWPDHCIQGSAGADFHPNLDTSQATLIVRKGYRRAIDSYSAYFENDHMTPTGLAGYCQEMGISRVFCAGLALDFCVKFSAEDAVACGFETFLIKDLCRAIDLDGSRQAAIDSMAAKSVQPIESDDLH
ncbi:MAG: bifunctional nicotinamidase/pyrazinamidase [Pseudomonadota bacterium]